MCLSEVWKQYRFLVFWRIFPKFSPWSQVDLPRLQKRKEFCRAGSTEGLRSRPPKWNVILWQGYLRLPKTQSTEKKNYVKNPHAFWPEVNYFVEPLANTNNGVRREQWDTDIPADEIFERNTQDLERTPRPTRKQVVCALRRHIQSMRTLVAVLKHCSESSPDDIPEPVKEGWSEQNYGGEIELRECVGL